ncbi:GD21398 [Drosophila simulans]|uniref:GD21398 n=1 Tax=Drosophila simulans TaxID=7240 RepID=B4QZE5_DROSI|nr:GD21398 [Drosophila simulans]
MLQQPDIGELWSCLRNAPSHSHTLTLIGTVRRNAVAISVEKSTWKICQQQQQQQQQQQHLQQQQQLYLQQQQWNPHGSDFNHCAPRSLRFDKHFSQNVRRQPPSALAPSSLFNGTLAEKVGFWVSCYSLIQFKSSEVEFSIQQNLRLCLIVYFQDETLLNLEYFLLKCRYT